jgi:transcriptional regulator with XRE-family HTH domain
MYNSQKIFDLLAARNLKNKDLLEHLGKNWNGSLSQVVNGDLRASKLEQIADFFGVSIDTFFIRDGAYQQSDAVSTNGRLNSVRTAAALSKQKVLEDLIAEKDKRIKLLEDMVELLKKQPS